MTPSQTGRLALTLLILMTLGAPPPAAQAQPALFNFDADDPGAGGQPATVTPFTDTDGGLSAAFSQFTTLQGPTGAFYVAPAASEGIGSDAGLGGNVLVGSPDGGLPDTLAVQFSRPLTDVSLDFAGIVGYETPPADGFPALFFSSAPEVTLSAFSGGPGGTLVGSVQSTGVLQADGLYEGPLSFQGGTPFDAITVAETAPTPSVTGHLPGGAFVSQGDLYLDNIAATPALAAVPEPSPFALLALGLLPGGLVVRKRRHTA